MQLVGFEGCCTARIVTGFGQTDTGEWDYRPGVDLTLEDILSQLKTLEFYSMRSGKGILTCITNNEQKTANMALKKAGWKHSRWCEKGSHPETKIRLWFKPLMEV
ncbi:MAG: hypothetical protein Unbinned6805contig1000_26 [Prokaryotic dsDNA virus sp.]|nr:MAG: hypothetical protein Unbinned6805contig1000_26 [Prokaryotic dsDNA virus sp.]|tara:strand:- start:30676 stop:30990 length:315 start_codon:yes stop_codon:yes gene_type:complete